MPDATSQTDSSAFRIAALDPDFLLGRSTRGIRFQLEYMKAQEGLAAATIKSTIAPAFAKCSKPTANASVIPSG